MDQLDELKNWTPADFAEFVRQLREELTTQDWLNGLKVGFEEGWQAAIEARMIGTEPCKACGGLGVRPWLALKRTIAAMQRKAQVGDA